MLIVNTGVLPLPPETAAGAEYHIYYLANHLANHGVEVHLISDVRSENAFHPRVKVYNFRFRHPPLRRFTGWLLTHAIGGFHSFIKYLEVVHGVESDIIHIHGRLTARLISKFKLRKPVVYTLHDQSPFTGAFRGLERLVRMMAYLTQEYRTVRRVDHVIAVSRRVYRELVEWMKIPEERVSRIPNGVDKEFFKPSKTKKPYVLFVGRLTKRKGVDVLLRSFAGIANTFREVRLIIVGEGEEKERLIELTKRLGIHNRVAFLMNIPRHMLQRLYADASIFVLPSRGEGLPLSLLEAMASGCAVVATKVSGVVDVVKHGYTGLLVELDNMEQLAQALEQLLSDPNLRKKLSINARKLVENEYSWNRVAKKTIEVYKKVLEGVQK